MDWITERLAVGDVDDALRLEALRQAGVSAVLSLSDYPTFLDDWGFAWRRVPLIDGEGNNAEGLRQALESLSRFLNEGHRVLVHCREGVSRAPFVTACHLAVERGWGIEAALAFVAARRPVANPHPALLSLWSTAEAAFGNAQSATGAGS